MKNNFITWYGYKHYMLNSGFVNISEWNRIHGKQIKRKEIIRYLESFYGKLGEEPKESNDKKIDSKVLVIIRNGKIKQFRLLAMCTLDTIKIMDNPFKNDQFSIISKIEDNDNYIVKTNRLMFSPIYKIEHELKESNTSCASYYQDENGFIFVRNPNIECRPDPEKLRRARNYIKEFSKWQNKRQAKNLAKSWNLSSLSLFKENLDIRDEIAWLLGKTNKYYDYDIMFDIFDYEQIAKNEHKHKETLAHKRICTDKTSSFYGALC